MVPGQLIDGARGKFSASEVPVILGRGLSSLLRGDLIGSASYRRIYRASADKLLLEQKIFENRRGLRAAVSSKPGCCNWRPPSPLSPTHLTTSLAVYLPRSYIRI